MKNLDFEWLTDEFMLYCRSIQLRKKPCAAMRKRPMLHKYILWQNRYCRSFRKTL